MLSKILIATVLATAAAQCVRPTVNSSKADRVAFKAEVLKCKTGFADLDVCVDTRPTRDVDVDCCLSCRPPVFPKPRCDAATKKACIVKLANATTRECTDAADFFNGFDRNTCCSDCKRRPPPAAIRPDRPDDVCTKAKFLECTKQQPECTAETLGLRKAGADSLIADKTCCGVCVPPQDRPTCTFRKVLANTVDADRCAPGEKPAPVEGSCALSCRPAAPVCAADCTDKQICVPTANGAKCRKKGSRKYKVKAKAAIKDFVDNLTDEELEVSIIEVVRRHCARALTNEDNLRVLRRCNAFQERLDTLKIIRKNRPKAGDDAADTVEVEITFDGADEKIRDEADSLVDPALRRLLAAEDANAGDLLNDAVTDSDASEDLTITSTDTGTSAASSTAAASLFAVALGLFCA